MILCLMTLLIAESQLRSKLILHLLSSSWLFRGAQVPFGEKKVTVSKTAGYPVVPTKMKPSCSGTFVISF